MDLGVFCTGDHFHRTGIYNKCPPSPEQHCYISTDHTEPRCISAGEGELGSCLFCHSHQPWEQLVPLCKLLSVGSRMSNTSKRSAGCGTQRSGGISMALTVFEEVWCWVEESCLSTHARTPLCLQSALFLSSVFQYSITGLGWG